MIEPPLKSRTLEDTQKGLGAKFYRVISEYRIVTLTTIIVLYVLIFSLVFPEIYVTHATLSAILLNMSIEVVVVIGMALLLISGEFDLSLGGTMTLSGVLCGYMIKLGLNIVLAILITFVVCIINGLINGTIVAKIGVNSFITTLATGIIYKGITVLIAGPGIILLPQNFTVLGQKVLFGLQLPVWFSFIIIGIFIYLVSRTRIFRQYYYIGGNVKAAKLCGINVDKMKIIAFIIAAVLAGYAGIITTARFGNAMVEAGTGIVFKAFTAAVIGGISIKGGIGSIEGAVLGVLFIALLNNGVIIANVNPFWQPIVLGLVLVAAVTLDVLVSRRKT